MLVTTPVRMTKAVLATVILVGAIAPLATDMYVPAFPQVATDLTATATQVQLTLTTFFVGMALGQLIGGPVSDQRGRRGLLIAAIAAGIGMLVGALWFDTPLIVAIICFFVMMSAQGLIGPNGGALASAAVPDHPGTGSALLGFTQWVAAGTIAPVAGPWGQNTALPMALLVVAGATTSLAGLLVIARPQTAPESPTTSHTARR